MKRITVFALVMALVISSCQIKEENEFEPDGIIFTATMESIADDATTIETKTSMDSYGNVLWKKGDQVSIFVASTINQHFQVTDASDGKTAAALNPVESTGFVAGGDIPNNVAYYPYAATTAIAKRSGGAYLISDIALPVTQIYAEDSFGSGAFPMTAVTSSISDYNLKFKNVLGGLKLQLTGTATITSISITGNNNEILCGAVEVTVSGTTTPSINMTDATAKTVTLDCGEGVQLNANTATAFIIALPPITMSGGFTVVVTDAEGKQMEIKTTKSQTITRSNLLKMPMVNYEATDLSATDLSAEGTANCYIVPSSGKYSFLAVKGNTLEPVGDVKGVKVLWETFGTKDVPEIGSIIAPSVDYNSSTNTIIFETNETYTQGSALIAAFSDASCTEGNVLWSWHIWCTSDDLSSNLVNLRNNAGTIMDRNLGATRGTRSEYSCFSLLYQYGRKDPFLGGYHKDSQTILQAASTGKWNTAALTDYDDAVKYPTTFFSSWAEGDEDAISWSVQKNMYDPCPPGYRIPDKYVYSAAAEYYSGESSMWSIGTRGTEIYWYNGNNYTDYQSVWFPNTNALFSASSLRSHRLYGPAVTRDGAVWTCGGSFYSGMYDGIVNTVSSWYLIPKKTGNAVRCVTESSPVVVNTESVSLSMNAITIDPNASFDISASLYPSNANVNKINWEDLSRRFTMTTNDDGSVRFTDNTGNIGRYNIGAYSPLAVRGSNDEWRINWNGSLADICEVTVCPSEPTDYRYYGGWYLKAKAGDTISFSYYIGDDEDGSNHFSVYVGGQLVYEPPYCYSSCSGNYSYTFDTSFCGWVYLWWGWHSNIWNITTTATVLGRGEPYPSIADYALNDRWISQPSYKFEYKNHVLTMH